MIVTLDGPVASGKSTLAKLISKNNNFFYLYSGLFYRAYAYILFDKMNINENDFFLIERKFEDVFFLYKNDENFNPVVFYKNFDITKFLFSEENGRKASLISSLKFIREKVLNFQRKIALNYDNLVADGRDCGINVFKNAEKKFFITASLMERVNRVNRRNDQELMESVAINFVKERDYKDLKRKIDPMQPAHDAIIINTTGLSLESVYNFILKALN